MGPRTRYSIALAVCVTVGLTALITSLSGAADRPGLPTGELLRLEELDQPADRLSEQVRWTFDVVGGDRLITDADLEDRYSETFGDAVTTEALNEQVVGFLGRFGPASFVRYLFTDDDRVVIALSAAENGSPLEVAVEVDEQGSFMLWAINDYQSGPRLPGWVMALSALAGWLAIAASVAVSRPRTTRTSWVLLLGSIASFSAFLMLASDPAVYTAGRVLPTAVLPIATWLLAERLVGGLRKAAFAAAVAGAVVATLGVLTRDANRIGHPDVFGLIVDSDAAMRTTLAAAAALAVAAMGALAGFHLSRLRAAGHWRSPPQIAAAAVALAWAAVALVAAIDIVAGGGRLTTGALRAAQLTLAAAVPIVVVFSHVSSRWDRPELAGLVIDLEAGGADLQRAVAQALEDESATVLLSPDGERLVDGEGAVVDADHPPAGRAVAQIRSGDRLVGGIGHDAALPMATVRLRAVGAAIGLALRVEQLNAQVNAQLDEVEASRLRIIEASDDARRRVERDLHDGAQQRLVGLGMKLQRARRLAAGGRNEEVVGLLDEASADTRAAIDELRSVSRGAPPALLADRGLRAAVEALAERSPVPVEISEAGLPLPPPVELTAYYVIAEGLTNTAKHSGADVVSVSIDRRNGRARVRVSDDGVGGATAAHRSGLEGLRDRVAAAGGDFSIVSDGDGTTIEASLPCG